MPAHRRTTSSGAPRPAAPLAGRFVLLDQVGSGGMGSVWRARDLRTDRLVACKVLGHHSAPLLVRFVREQAVRVRHPHVAAPTGWAVDDDVVLLAMDLVGGGSVKDLLDAHGPLPAGYAARLLEQLLSALSAVHSAGLVHRDVKPANLLLEPTGDGPPHLRLADFGVAAPIADTRFTTVPGAVGTEGYMAPEQARGAVPDPAQDLYAVGRVGLQLVTGLSATRQGSSPAVPSHPLRPLLEQLLVRDPEQRLASAEAALRVLRRLRVPDEPGPPVPDRLGPPPDRQEDLLPWLAVVGCVAVTVGCLLALAGALLG